MRAKALALLILLAGCERPVTHAEAEAIGRDAAGDAYNSRISDLEQRVDKLDLEKDALEASLNVVEIQQERDDAVIAALDNQVSGNAKVYNDHIRAER